MEKPKISVVTVCYNAVKTIEETMLSVLNQTYGNIEYIIIDGGSSDGTVDIIKKYADFIDYWISEPDKGIYDAMNKGIDVATGDYINFMNAGDTFYNLTVVERIFHNNHNEEIIYGDAIFVYPYGKLYVKPRPLEIMTERDPIMHQSNFTKTSLLKEEPFDISYKIAADYNFFYKQYFKGVPFKYLNIPISFFDAMEGISSNAISLRLTENLRVTGKVKDIHYVVTLLKLLLINKLRKLLFKIFPKATGSYQLKRLAKDPRINIIASK